VQTNSEAERQTCACSYGLMMPTAGEFLTSVRSMRNGFAHNAMRHSISINQGMNPQAKSILVGATRSN
jgi:hypothetical protein